MAGGPGLNVFVFRVLGLSPGIADRGLRDAGQGAQDISHAPEAAAGRQAVAVSSSGLAFHFLLLSGKKPQYRQAGAYSSTARPGFSAASRRGRHFISR